MNTLTFTVTLPSRVGTTLSINIIGTNLYIDYGDGTTTTQEPNTDTIEEQHSYPMGSGERTYNVTISGNIIGLGDNCLGNSVIYDISLPEGLQTIGNMCLSLIRPKKIIIPSTVTTIGSSFLSQSAVEEVVFLSKNLNRIGTSFLYYNTTVKSVKLPEGLKTLSMYSFANCTGLKTLEVPSTLTSFPNLTYSFTNVQLDTLKMNGGPISNPPINENTKIIVPLNKLQDFINHSDYPDERERYDIFGKNLSEKVYVLGVHLAENLQDKNIVASADDGLTTLAEKIDNIYANTPRVIVEDDTVTDFADLRFTFVFPKNCRRISGRSLSYWKNLKHCILPEGPSSLETCAFMRCSNLVEITIPNTIASIGDNVFANTTSLNKIVFKSTTPPEVLYANAFSNLPTTCIIEVPIGSLKTYKNASNYPDPNVYTYRSLYYENDFSDSSTISDFTDGKGTITKSITNGELVLTAPNNDEHLTYCNKAKLPKGDWKVTVNSTTYDFLAVKIGYDPLDSNATVFDCTWNYGWGLVKINSDWSQTAVNSTSSINLGTAGVWVFEYIDKVMKIYQDNVLKATYDLTSYDTIGGYVAIGDCCNRTNRISELIIEEL